MNINKYLFLLQTALIMTPVTTQCMDIFDAVREGDLNRVRDLIDTNQTLINARDNRSCTPLHVAASKGRIEIARLLLQHNADVNALDDGLRTPLHRAAYLRYTDIVQLLLLHKAKADIPDVNTNTPLFEAVIGGCVNVVKLLLQQRDVNVNARDKMQRIPLHMAVMVGGIPEIVSLLLQHNADVNAQDKNGKTPLSEAVKKDKTTLVKLLLEHNAIVNFSDLYVAASNNNLETVHLILQHNEGVNTIDNCRKIVDLLVCHEVETNVVKGCREILRLLQSKPDEKTIKDCLKIIDPLSQHQFDVNKDLRDCLIWSDKMLNNCATEGERAFNVQHLVKKLTMHLSSFTTNRSPVVKFMNDWQQYRAHRDRQIEEFRNCIAEYPPKCRIDNYLANYIIQLVRSDWKHDTIEEIQRIAGLQRVAETEKTINSLKIMLNNL